MNKTLKMAAMLLAVVAVIATGCKKPEAETYTVVFNANGGTGTMENQIFTEGQSQALTANAFSYEGYAFAGWNTKADGTGTAYTDQQTITITDNMTLYAQWLKGYTVTFDANGGTGTMQPQSFTEGETKALTANAFTYEYHTFVNWNTVADGSGDTYTDGQEITVTVSITLYAQWSNTVNGHTWVDLGLPSGTLWATTNVGADTPEAYGDYFAWGETQPQASNEYSWSSYKYCNGSSWGDPRFTKYCPNADYGDNGFTDTLTRLLPEDDAATANWGNGWRMPTKEEQEELLNNCTVEWTTQNGINGFLFTAANGNKIFLPAAGVRYDDILSDEDGVGRYWSSSLKSTFLGWALRFEPDEESKDYYVYGNGRHVGQTVRPVIALQ